MRLPVVDGQTVGSKAAYDAFLSPASPTSRYNLFWDDTKKASDHFPVIVDFVLPMINQTGVEEYKSNKDIIRIKDILGRDVEERKNTPLFYIYDNGTVEKKVIIE